MLSATEFDNIVVLLGALTSNLSRHSAMLRMLQKAGLLAAGVFAAAEWIDPKDTETASDTAAPD